MKKIILVQILEWNLKREYLTAAPLRKFQIYFLIKFIKEVMNEK